VVLIIITRDKEKLPPISLTVKKPQMAKAGMKCQNDI
jgi:hypothetical protein